LLKGQIVGNTITKKYVIIGANVVLPEARNRIYFNTEAEARAAGYTRAGSGRVTPVQPPRLIQFRDPRTGRFIRRPGTATGKPSSPPARDPKTGRFIKRG
jgi:hypothetical protein